MGHGLTTTAACVLCCAVLCWGCYTCRGAYSCKMKEQVQQVAANDDMWAKRAQKLALLSQPPKSGMERRDNPGIGRAL